jgi:hypothetical protein
LSDKSSISRFTKSGPFAVLSLAPRDWYRLRTLVVAALMDGIEGFLVESRSIGGLSGSPVFIQRSIEVQATEITGRKPLAAGAMFWLGLVHGHWDVKESQVDSVSSDAWGKGHDHVNTGMAIVVPFDKIMEVISQDELKYWADTATQEFRTHNAPILDGGSPAGSAVSEGKEELATYGLTSVTSRMTTPSSGTFAPVFEYLKEQERKSGEP